MCAHVFAQISKTCAHVFAQRLIHCSNKVSSAPIQNFIKITTAGGGQVKSAFSYWCATYLFRTVCCSVLQCVPLLNSNCTEWLSSFMRDISLSKRETYEMCARSYVTQLIHTWHASFIHDMSHERTLQHTHTLYRHNSSISDTPHSYVSCLTNAHCNTHTHCNDIPHPYLTRLIHMWPPTKKH